MGQDAVRIASGWLCERLPDRFSPYDPALDPNWLNDGCHPLTNISHVAHLETALRIAADGKFKAGLMSTTLPAEVGLGSMTQ
jgi:hypothetical protein